MKIKNNNTDNINDKINDSQNLLYITKKVMLAQPIFLVSSTLLGTISGNISAALCYSLLLTAPVLTSCSLAYHKEKENLKKLESKLEEKTHKKNNTTNQKKLILKRKK